MKHTTSAWTFFLILLGTCCTGWSEEPQPAKIAFSETVRFKGIHDPGYIRLELSNGKVIDTTYSGIDWETLYAWETDQETSGEVRTMVLSYTDKQGVRVRDKKTDMDFALSGPVNPHPIEMAAERLFETHLSTMAIKHVQSLQINSWKAELKRAVEQLGGANDPELQAAQKAWETYRKAQLSYLQSEYGTRQGTMWGIVYLSQVTDLVKGRVITLQSIHSDR